ncbi:MAG: bifunctional 4-hydroxy-2-oxoglutarate aldolase/2-dehydro-3-deoxy-phosphogluconate aldolase [Planctomicrobium sp.]|jgi:2-dehydro-3-deoxyphosphogluconate aldolase / (4S)-4-hydroxy-2-oxoglutarate aldolase|nr:bifunctional 4-hydroxy-2-oxoglutarate aldolase/2-dehydro-3-deoxy-phosphogluconate aldolase [Planctomicrobium sp.]
MSKETDLQRVLDLGLVAIIRAPNGDRLLEVAEALYAGGIDVIEVTFTVPGVIDIIKQLRDKIGDRILLGAGTVLDVETARAAILAGAEFIVTPTVNTEVIKLCQRYGKVVMSGAFTPTEILTAWEAGADIVKVFPADVGGPSYLKAVHGPLPQVRLLPTGGVNLDTLNSFVKAGACAVGLGGALVEKDALENGDMQRIENAARDFVKAMQKARVSNQD